jgi:hypothetical protein
MKRFSGENYLKNYLILLLKIFVLKQGIILISLEFIMLKKELTKKAFSYPDKVQLYPEEYFLNETNFIGEASSSYGENPREIAFFGEPNFLEENHEGDIILSEDKTLIEEVYLNEQPEEVKEVKEFIKPSIESITTTINQVKDEKEFNLGKKYKEIKKTFTSKQKIGGYTEGVSKGEDSQFINDENSLERVIKRNDKTSKVPIEGVKENRGFFGGLKKKRGLNKKVLPTLEVKVNSITNLYQFKSLVFSQNEGVVSLSIELPRMEQ